MPSDKELMIANIDELLARASRESLLRLKMRNLEADKLNPLFKNEPGSLTSPMTTNTKSSWSTRPGRHVTRYVESQERR